MCASRALSMGVTLGRGSSGSGVKRSRPICRPPMASSSQLLWALCLQKGAQLGVVRLAVQFRHGGRRCVLARSDSDRDDMLAAASPAAAGQLHAHS